MPFEYNYERFEELLKKHLETMWRNPDALSIGEDISDTHEIKIIFDGYGDLETDDEYIEGGDKNMESYAIFIHKDTLTEDFTFPEHDTAWNMIIHRPKEEVCVYAWYDVKNDEWEILDLEERLEDTELDTEQVMNIMEALHKKYFEKTDFDFGDVLPTSAWPFPTGDKK